MTAFFDFLWRFLQSSAYKFETYKSKLRKIQGKSLKKQQNGLKKRKMQPGGTGVPTACLRSHAVYLKV